MTDPDNDDLFEHLVDQLGEVTLDLSDTRPAQTPTVASITVDIFGVPTNFVHESEADRWADLALEVAP